MKVLWRKTWEWITKHAPLVISSAITVIALTLYYAVFVGARPTPWFEFIERVELATLDLRFEIRGRQTPDPRIIIVDIDQQTQEMLGRWPFPRIHFATMLDKLREDGAKVVAFDITFSHAGQTREPIEVLQERLEKRGAAKQDRRLRNDLEAIKQEFDYDARFAKAIEGLGRVVLGNFFLFNDSDMKGVSEAELDRFANLVAYHPFPQVLGGRSAQGEESRIQTIRNMGDKGMVPQGAEANIEPLTLALPAETASAGYFNIFPDSDGVVRHAQMAIPYGRDEDLAAWDFYAPIGVHATRLLLDLPLEKVVLRYGREGLDSIEFGDLIVPTDDLGRVVINYRGPARTYPYISLSQVISGKFEKGTFKDKLVLVGASATGIGDLRVTPFSKQDFPGVEFHANTADNILHGDFIVRGGKQLAVDVFFILLFGVPLGLGLGMVEPRRMWWAMILLAPFLGIAYFAFTHGWWLNVVTPALLTLVPNTLTVGLVRVLAVERERRRTRDAFQQYISPEVVRRLLKSPDLVKPRKIEISIMFTDVRGFTSLSEDLDAQEVAHLLNHYLSEMTRIVFRHQGTLDKYMGDGMMAFWGAPFEEPLHSPKACYAALGMIEKLRDLQKEWLAAGKPRMDIGIGVNTGMASVGNMGSQLRYGYTVIGDAVNLASRLEGMNKVYGTRILVTEETRLKANDPKLLFRELDWIRVTGKKQRVSIYELPAVQNGSSEWPERITLFEAGLAAYRNRDWILAHSCFETLLMRWPEDGPGQLFLTRCEEFLTAPPSAQWDGVYVAKTK